MSMTWRNSLSSGLRAILDKTQSLDDDVYEGAKLILADADHRVPTESGDLLASGDINKARGGNNGVAITYAGPYARWIHEHLHFKHPHGGEAKYLETAMLVKGRAAINEAGEHLWRRL